jgi:hypothetical protein
MAEDLPNPPQPPQPLQPPQPGPPPVIDYRSPQQGEKWGSSFVIHAVGGFFSVFVAGGIAVALSVRFGGPAPAIVIGIVFLLETILVSFVYRKRGWLTGVLLAIVVVALLLAACGIII